MIRRVAANYAFRSLFRHTRRTLLSVVGVGVGVAIALFSASWVRGAIRMEIRAAVESGAGHLRIVPTAWLDKRENSLRLSHPDEDYEAARSLRYAQVVAPRARTNGLLAFGNRSAGVEMIGVEPEAEGRLSRIVQRAEIEGRYLEASDAGKVVIGKDLAERLDVLLDDELYVTLSGADGMQGAMFIIVGLVETGSEDIDSTFCHVTLDTLNEVTGYSGPGEITILLTDYKHLTAAQRQLARRVPPGDTVLTWKDINPSYAAGIESDRAFTKILIGIIILVVALGIAAAQLAAVLERRRELAILSALGMKGRQVISLIVLEALAIGLGGMVVAVLVGGSGAYYLASHGVDLEALMGGDASFGAVLLDPVVYGDFGFWLIWYALVIAEVATVGASIYPAWMAVRIDPADALRTI
ncbi:MAG: ABC transporter permease [Sedimentisphaerales bacterium]|nr:ABC transporter permease [Sedimentisphaerales bacterium]